jgi:dUTP pyrophosphatase
MTKVKKEVFPTLDIKVKKHSRDDLALPKYMTDCAAGADLCADIDEPITLLPGKRVVVPTGLSFEVPYGYEIQIRPRSGIASKHGITVVNTPGTIDAGYRGIVGVILINHGDEPFYIERGDRIAQMVVTVCWQANFLLVDELSDSERGAGGFGHTGK